MDMRLIAAVLAMRGVQGLRVARIDAATELSLSKCIQCGQPRNHNNSFCSAACCKAYKEKKRNPPTSEASDAKEIN